MSKRVFTELLLSDMAPSFGVTEPGAIALAVSRARSFTEGKIKSIDLSVNSGIYKNSFTCGVPGTVPGFTWPRFIMASACAFK